VGWGKLGLIHSGPSGPFSRPGQFQVELNSLLEFKFKVRVNEYKFLKHANLRHASHLGSIGRIMGALQSCCATENPGSKNDQFRCERLVPLGSACAEAFPQCTCRIGAGSRVCRFSSELSGLRLFVC
jgi:hypothetical protein